MNLVLTRLMAERAFMSLDPRLGRSHVSKSSHAAICFRYPGAGNRAPVASGDATIVNVRPNNRLKLSARGRPVADGWLRTRAAA
jgi:hypothetical protein